MEINPGAIHLPDNWRFYAASLAAMIALAGLDMVGAVFAKEWAERGRIMMFLLGWASFSVLFIVYARSLKFAELSTVPTGWVVFLQVGLLAVDSMLYDVTIPRSKWVAVAVILLLQCYLVLTPNGSKDTESASGMPPTQPSMTAPANELEAHPAFSASAEPLTRSQMNPPPRRTLGPNSGRW